MSVLLVVDFLLGYGVVGAVFAVLIAGGTAFLSYWKSDAVALRMSRARAVTPEEQPRLHNLVDGLCIAAGLPKPGVYIVDDPAPNAFATGRNPSHASIAVTTGLLEKLNRMELEGVLAHELSHVKNYDILVSTIAVTLVGVVMLVSDVLVRMFWFGGITGRRKGSDSTEGGNPLMLVVFVLGAVLLVLSPLLARLMQAAVSRRRETLADLSGCELTRYPPGLISALEKLKSDETVVHSGSRATAHLWIEQPIARDEHEGKMSRWNRLFDTHPPLDERIALLREL